MADIQIRPVNSSDDENQLQPKRGVVDQLLGTTGDRYQVWPERLARQIWSAFYDPPPTEPTIEGDTPEAIQAWKEYRDAIDYKLGGLSAAFGPGLLGARKGAAGVFGGRLSQTFPRAQYEAMPNLGRLGYHPDEIWKHTGVGMPEMFGDRMMRHEIPDYRSQILQLPKNRETLPAAVVFDHPELWAAYPKLRNFPIEGVDKPNFALAGVRTAGPNPRMFINLARQGESDTRQSLLHEFGHVVDSLEGFARGSSPQEFRPSNYGALHSMLNRQGTKAIEETMGKAAEIARQHGIPLDEVLYQQLYNNMLTGGKSPITGMIPNQAQHLIQQLQNDPAILKSMSRIMPIKKRLDEINSEAFENYQAVVGEQMARIAEKRADMHPRRLEQTTPWSMYDVPLEKQIYKGVDSPPKGFQAADIFDLAKIRAERAGTLGGQYPGQWPAGSEWQKLGYQDAAKRISGLPTELQEAILTRWPEKARSAMQIELASMRNAGMDRSWHWLKGIDKFDEHTLGMIQRHAGQTSQEIGKLPFGDVFTGVSPHLGPSWSKTPVGHLVEALRNHSESEREHVLKLMPQAAQHYFRYHLGLPKG